MSDAINKVAVAHHCTLHIGTGAIFSTCWHRCGIMHWHDATAFLALWCHKRLTSLLLIVKYQHVVCQHQMFQLKMGVFQLKMVVFHHNVSDCAGKCRDFSFLCRGNFLVQSGNSGVVCWLCCGLNDLWWCSVVVLLFVGWKCAKDSPYGTFLGS